MQLYHLTAPERDTRFFRPEKIAGIGVLFDMIILDDYLGDPQNKFEQKVYVFISAFPAAVPLSLLPVPWAGYRR